MVAVPPQEGLAIEAGHLELVAVEELAEVQRQVGQPTGVVIVGQDLRELVAENGQAARFHPDDGGPGADVGAQRIEDLVQVPLGHVQEAVVVERAAAADMTLGHDHLPPRRLDGLHARHAHLCV